MDIQLTDYKGHTWHLAGAQEGDEGVTLHKISGTGPDPCLVDT